VFSLVAGFLLGWIMVKLVELAFSRINRRSSRKVFVVVQDICAIALSFLHGAQDGQKFMSIAVLGIALSFGMESADTAGFPLWLMITCSVAISAGTFLGGKRIIKSVAMDMVKLEKYQGVAASLSTVITLFVSSMTGMPVSTSHCSTSAIMGVGAVKRLSAVNFSVVKDMCLAWVLTFPGCALVGFLMTKLFLHVL
jgi:PiT family inorganic phosphate transporter